MIAAAGTGAHRAYRIPAGKRYDLREEDSMAKGNNSRRKETKKPKKDKK